MLDKFKAAGVTPLAIAGQGMDEMTLLDSVTLSTGGLDFYKKAFVDLDQASLGSDVAVAFDQPVFLGRARLKRLRELSFEEAGEFDRAGLLCREHALLVCLERGSDRGAESLAERFRGRGAGLDADAVAQVVPHPIEGRSLLGEGVANRGEGLIRGLAHDLSQPARELLGESLDGAVHESIGRMFAHDGLA